MERHWWSNRTLRKQTSEQNVQIPIDDPRNLLLPKDSVSETDPDNRYSLPLPPPSVLENIDRSHSQVVRTEVITHSVTRSYQKEEWGPLRIALDGIQNHLISDAKASWFGVQFRCNGQWYDHSRMTDFSNRDIDAVRFLDDGRGFVPEELTVMSTSKSKDKRSAGQFGEGLKMVSAAALRGQMEMLIESRDWQATPFFEGVNLTDRKEQRLQYQVSYFQESIQGSRTTFFKPTGKFLSIIRDLDKYVLPIRGNNYEPLVAMKSVDIVDTHGNVYVKGLRYDTGQFRPFFSYNFVDLNDRAIKRDRESIDPEDAGSVFRAMQEALPHVTDEEAILELVKTGLSKGMRYDEFNLLNGIWMPWRLYEEAVYKIAGTDKAFIVSQGLFGRAINARRELYLRNHGYKALHVGDLAFERFLKGPVGIPTADSWIFDELIDSQKDQEVEELRPEQLSSNERRVLELISVADDFLETPSKLRKDQIQLVKFKRRRNNDFEMLFLDLQERRGSITIDTRILKDPEKFLKLFIQLRAKQIVENRHGNESQEYVDQKIASFLLKLNRKGQLQIDQSTDEITTSSEN